MFSAMPSSQGARGAISKGLFTGFSGFTVYAIVAQEKIEPMCPRRQMEPWAAFRGAVPAGQGRQSAPLFGPGEASPGLLCPVLGSAQDRHGAPGVGAAEGYGRELKPLLHEERLRELFSQEKIL